MSGDKLINIPKQKQAQKDVLVMGDVLRDYQYWVKKLPQPGDDEEIIMSNQDIGGSATNTAIALTSLKIACGLSARIGQDEVGKQILNQLESIGLDLSCMQYGETTGYTITIVDKNGERTMFSYRGASAEVLEFTSELRHFLNQAQLLILSGYYLVHEQQAEMALMAAGEIKKAGGLVAFDPSPNIGLVKESLLDQMFALTDLILPNKRELQIITKSNNIEQGLEQLLQKIPAIALKLGSEGSMLALNKGFKLSSGEVLTKQQTFFQPAVQTVPLDTTGAGDSFNAGVIASLLKEESPEKWLKTGNSLAARVIARKGASSLFF